MVTITVALERRVRGWPQNKIQVKIELCELLFKPSQVCTILLL